MNNKNRRILFLDRDGTLIIEPEDKQIDSLEKLELVEGVIPALLKLKAAGYEFVIVSNQDGLGTASNPWEKFQPPHDKMLSLFTSQGIEFVAEHIDPHFEQDGAATRKPGIGMLLDYLKSGQLDFADSWVIGDRQTDLQLADNMGIGGILCGPDGQGWDAIAHQLCTRPRRATVQRNTNETQISVLVDLDASGENQIDTGIGFFDHMLDQLARHAMFDLTVRAKGDHHIDDHHTVEDTGIALGQALVQAVGDKKGIQRYGSCLLPMDDALVRAALDLSARPYLVWNVALPTAKIGTFDTELVREFFQALSTHGGITLHIDKLHGFNAHHIVEAAFKAVARALRDALEIDPRKADAIPSTKGML